MKRLLCLMISLSTSYSLSAMHTNQVLEKVNKVIRLPSGKRLTVHTWQRVTASSKAPSESPVKRKTNCGYCDKELSRNYVYTHEQYYCRQNPDCKKITVSDFIACKYCSMLFSAGHIELHQKRDCTKNKMSLKYILNEPES